MIKKQPYWIGVDPGAPLAMAIVGPSGKLLDVVSYRQVAYTEGKKTWHNSPMMVSDILKDWHTKTKGNVKVMIENVGPRPGENIVHAAKFVGSIWMIKGMCAMINVPVYVVSPVLWKGYFKLKGGPENKGMSRERAMMEWPFQKDLFSRAMDADAAEAALMAVWAIAHHNAPQGEKS